MQQREPLYINFPWYFLNENGQIQSYWNSLKNAILINLYGTQELVYYFFPLQICTVP